MRRGVDKAWTRRCGIRVVTQSGVRWCDVTSMQTSGILSVALGGDSSREELSGYGARMPNSPLPPIDTPVCRCPVGCTSNSCLVWRGSSDNVLSLMKLADRCTPCAPLRQVARVGCVQWPLFLWNCCGRNPAVRDARSAFVVEVGCGRCRRQWEFGRCRSAWRSWWLQTPAHLVNGGLGAAKVVVQQKDPGVVSKSQ